MTKLDMYMYYVQYINKAKNYMILTSYTSLRKGLSNFMDKIARDREVLHISRKGHDSMVMLSEEDYNSMQETLYLLSSPNNAARLNESTEQAKNKEFVEVDLNAD